MNILLTGGAGYIGSHVAINLLDAGYKVTIIDDLSTGHQQLIPKKANFIKANINDVNILDTILTKNKFDILMHFAGFIQVEESVKNPKKYFLNNTNNANNASNKPTARRYICCLIPALDSHSDASNSGKNVIKL